VTHANDRVIQVETEFLNNGVRGEDCQDMCRVGANNDEDDHDDVNDDGTNQQSAALLPANGRSNGRHLKVGLF
jgi:hypothetical protein